MPPQMRYMGNVSIEGGPLLIADRDSAGLWTGAAGPASDYLRACNALNQNPRLNGTEVDIEGVPAVIWSMPTGTADCWRLAPASIVITRMWRESVDARTEFLAGLPSDNPPVRIGQLRLSSGWVVVVWAAEAGGDIIRIEPEDGQPLDLSVGGAGLVAALPPGNYVCTHDEVRDGDDTVLRCSIAPEARDG